MPRQDRNARWRRKKGDWKPPKATKGCIRKVLELCKKTEKVRGEIADLGRYYKHELVDDRTIKLRPEEIEPWDKELAERTEAAQKVIANYKKLVTESEKLRRDCPGTRLVFDREHEKAYCTLSHEGGFRGEGYAGIGRKAWTSVALYKEKVKRRDPKWKRQLKQTDTFARGLGFSLKGHKAIKQWIDKIFTAPKRLSEWKRAERNLRKEKLLAAEQQVRRERSLKDIRKAREEEERKTAIVPYTVPPPPIVYRTA